MIIRLFVPEPTRRVIRDMSKAAANQGASGFDSDKPHFYSTVVVCTYCIDMLSSKSLLSISFSETVLIVSSYCEWKDPTTQHANSEASGISRCIWN